MPSGARPALLAVAAALRHALAVRDVADSYAGHDYLQDLAQDFEYVYEFDTDLHDNWEHVVKTEAQKRRAELEAKQAELKAKEAPVDQHEAMIREIKSEIKQQGGSFQARMEQFKQQRAEATRFTGRQGETLKLPDGSTLAEGSSVAVAEKIVYLPDQLGAGRPGCAIERDDFGVVRKVVDGAALVDFQKPLESRQVVSKDQHVPGRLMFKGMAPREALVVGSAVAAKQTIKYQGLTIPFGTTGVVTQVQRKGKAPHVEVDFGDGHREILLEDMSKFQAGFQKGSSFVVLETISYPDDESGFQGYTIDVGTTGVLSQVDDDASSFDFDMGEEDLQTKWVLESDFIKMQARDVEATEDIKWTSSNGREQYVVKRGWRGWIEEVSRTGEFRVTFFPPMWVLKDDVKKLRVQALPGHHGGPGNRDAGRVGQGTKGHYSLGPNPVVGRSGLTLDTILEGDEDQETPGDEAGAPRGARPGPEWARSFCRFHRDFVGDLEEDCEAFVAAQERWCVLLEEAEARNTEGSVALRSARLRLRPKCEEFRQQKARAENSAKPKSKTNQASKLLLTKLSGEWDTSTNERYTIEDGRSGPRGRRARALDSRRAA